MKNIPGYEGYYTIDENGDCFSVPRNGTVKHALQLKVNTGKNGYGSFLLQKNGIKKRLLIHRLVAITFIANPENKKYVNHIDGDKSNNNVLNLEWCTHSENEIHAHKTGLKKFQGNGNPARKVDSYIVSIMRQEYSLGVSQTYLAQTYGVCPSCVSRIVNKKNWNY